MPCALARNLGLGMAGHAEAVGSGAATTEGGCFIEYTPRFGLALNLIRGLCMVPASQIGAVFTLEMGVCTGLLVWLGCMVLRISSAFPFLFAK